MSCCGQSRQRAIDPLASGFRPARKVKIAYLGSNSLRVRGTYSGNAYTFSPDQPVQMVDANDSRVMLKTRYSSQYSMEARRAQPPGHDRTLVGRRL